MVYCGVWWCMVVCGTDNSSREVGLLAARALLCTWRPVPAKDKLHIF